MNRKGTTATSINFAIHIKGSDPELTRAAGELGAYLRDLPYVTMDHPEGMMDNAGQMLFSGQVDAEPREPDVRTIGFSFFMSSQVFFITPFPRILSSSSPA